MSVSWATLRTRVRRSILGDTGTSPVWSDDQLLDYIGWALDEFCAHTAVATSTSYPCDGETHEFVLPDNIYEPITRAGAVALKQDEQIEYLEPIRFTPGATWPDDEPDETSQPRAFWEWPTGTLRLGFIPKDSSTLTVYYFAHWDKPTDDNSILDVPHWAEEALAYLVGAIAMSPLGVQTSNIRRWNDRLDSGTPEHNPSHRQAEFFRRMYQEVLRVHPPQERENFFKAGPGL